MDNQKDEEMFGAQYKINEAKREKEWQKFKKNFLNKDSLIIFIAISIAVIDLLVFIICIPNLRSEFRSAVLNIQPTAVSETANQENFASSDQNSTEEDDDNCNVVGINLHGDLVTYIPKEDGGLTVDETASEDVYFSVKHAERKDNIKAVVVEIDSSGGDPTAGEEVEKALKGSAKPVVAYIRSVGTSAAYWAATGADRIFALPASQVGSIAVSSSYLDQVKYNQEKGYNFNNLATGKFKNTMDSDKSLTEEERSLIMKDLYETHDLFVGTVAKNRKLDINKVKEIADGWTYSGVKALNLGLIDELGGLDEVRAYLEKNVLNNERAIICWQ